MKCPICKRKALTTLRSGGWTVDCYYSDAWNSLQDYEPYCECEGTKLFDTEREAVKEWNKNVVLLRKKNKGS